MTPTYSSPLKRNLVTLFARTGAFMIHLQGAYRLIFPACLAMAPLILFIAAARR